MATRQLELQATLPLYVSYYNSLLASWEPLIEPWHVVIKARSTPAAADPRRYCPSSSDEPAAVGSARVLSVVVVGVPLRSSKRPKWPLSPSWR